VQIIKAILLISGTILLSFMVMAHFGFSLGAFFTAVSQVHYHTPDGTEVVKGFPHARTAL
jgi:cation/acetate symporter